MNLPAKTKAGSKWAAVLCVILVLKNVFESSKSMQSSAYALGNRTKVEERNGTTSDHELCNSSKIYQVGVGYDFGSPAESLKSGVSSFLLSHRNRNHSVPQKHEIWTLLENYEMSQNATGKDNDASFFYYRQDLLGLGIVCGTGPGQGLEQDAGYKLLTEKIKIGNPESRNSKDHETQPRLLCLVYTYSPMRYLLRSQALTWGRYCDGFLALSNESLPALGIYELPLPLGLEESYTNMWQKTRTIWKHVRDHYLDDYDYFFLGGDDVYLLVENLRVFLSELSLIDDNKSTSKTPRHFGSWLPSRSMVAGGPGYVLNQAALRQYIDTSVWTHCLSDRHESYEDRFLSHCLSHHLGIHGNLTDTRDPSTGEQRFHDAEPATLFLTRAARSLDDRRSSYLARMMKTWEDQPMPNANANAGSDDNDIVGRRYELEAAAVESISLHRIHTPTYMARIHAILHQTCPNDSPLGKGLLQHSKR